MKNSIFLFLTIFIPKLFSMKKIFLSVIVSFFLLTGSKSFAQIYISFEGVRGESSFKAFPSSTQIDDLSWGVKNPTTLSATGGTIASRPQLNDLVFTKLRGVASPALQTFVFNGKIIPKAEIRFYKAGVANPYLTLLLENVLITNWSITTNDQGFPAESFSLNFGKFKSEDQVMKPDGTIEKLPAGWDILRNVAN
jgi:type VI protein secretion system component Hcp